MLQNKWPFFKFAQSKVPAYKEMTVPMAGGNPLTSEIATRQRSIDFFTMGFFLPNPDPVLKAMGKDVQVYTDLKADGYLSGCLLSRKSATLKQEWGIDRGKSKSRQARAIEDALKRLDMHRIISEMLDGAGFGYAPMEVIWETRDNLWLPKDIVGKPQRWFVYDEHNELKMRTKQNWNGEPLPDWRFLVARKEPTYDNPYGVADLSRCFWPVVFKRNGLAFWAKFSEKYGMPYFVGKLKRGLEQPEYDKLRDTLDAMVQDAIAVIPDDGSVEILSQGANSSSADNYEKFIQTCKKEISVVNLGHEGAVQSTPGRLGGENVAEKVMDSIVTTDTKMVETQINLLIDWIFNLNFGEGSRPTFSMWEPEEVDKDLADRDKILSDQGVRFKKSYYAKAYSLEEEDFDVAEPKPIPDPNAPPPPASAVPPAFADKTKPVTPSAETQTFPDQAALDEAIAQVDPDAMQGMMEELLKPVLSLIQNGTDADTVMAKLAECYPMMDETALKEILAKAFFVSEIWGQLNAKKKSE